MPKKIETQTIQLMIQMYQQGQSSGEIAKELNTASQTVIKYLKEYGIKIRGPEKFEIDPQEIVKLYRGQGLTSSKIAGLFGVSDSYILKVLRAHGIKSQQGRPKVKDKTKIPEDPRQLKLFQQPLRIEIIMEENIQPILTITDNKFEQIIEVNGQLLTANYLRTLSETERQALVEPVFEIFRTQGWLYPNDFKDVKRSYQKLLDHQPNLSVLELNNNSSLGTDICKHFCHTFYSATEQGKQTMLEAFGKDEELKRIIANRMGLGWKKNPEFFNISHRMLIQGMRSMRAVPMISMFKPAIAKYMCLKYSEPGDLVFDYSAGFGGRMLGAASCGRQYRGVDPLTVPELKEMRNQLGLKDCELLHWTSEEFEGEEDSVDLAWSSPPYYNQEYYSTDKTQAYNKGSEYFYDVYWQKTLNNCRSMLKPGKWFGLNVKNFPRMLEMALRVFGPVIEEVKLKTYASHLSSLHHKYESIYMFRNNK